MGEKDSIEAYAARMKVFLPNRQKFPLEELARYAGQCIAWNSDGTAIVASAPDYETQAGIDLTGSLLGESAGVGRTRLSYRCAAVTLRISDGKESCVWQAVVGFIDVPRCLGLLGIAGFLEFFDSNLLAFRLETLLSP